MKDKYYLWIPGAEKPELEGYFNSYPEAKIKATEKITEGAESALILHCIATVTPKRTVEVNDIFPSALGEVKR